MANWSTFEPLEQDLAISVTGMSIHFQSSIAHFKNIKSSCVLGSNKIKSISQIEWHWNDNSESDLCLLIPVTWYAFSYRSPSMKPTEFKIQDLPQLFARTMYLMSSVPSLCTLIHYLSGPVSQPGNQSLYQIMQITSSHPHLSVFHLQGCSKLPTVTSYCRNESRTSRDIPSMHTSPDTPAQPCNSDPTLANTSTPWHRLLPEYCRDHMDAFPKLRTYKKWKWSLLLQNPLSTQTTN